MGDAGYRIYTHLELEQLQQILFYRELDFSLKKIILLLQSETDRLSVLYEQRDQLLRQRKRLNAILKTADRSIWHAEKGVIMDAKAMFKGIDNTEEWNDALKEQNEHLQNSYGTTAGTVTDVDAMNQIAAEAASFMAEMASALKNKVAYDDLQVRTCIEKHLAFLREHGHDATAESFMQQTAFFTQDSFHRSMLEDQQIGLSYYLAAAARAYAK